MKQTPVYFNDGGDGADDQPHTFFTEVSNKLYEHYLDYGLDDFTVPRQLCTLLRGVEPSDTVVIRINSPGGRLDVATQIINAIRECQATVIGIIEQDCASAASMIFLACDQWQVQPWGEMMIHYASYGVIGKGNEITSRVKATEKRLRNVFEDIYADFLNPDEIETIANGQDMYLTQDEIVDRLEALIEKRKEAEEDESEELEEADQCVQICESCKE